MRVGSERRAFAEFAEDLGLKPMPHEDRRDTEW